MRKPENEINRETTSFSCKSCKNPIVLIYGEISDGQNSGGTESVTFFWCDFCEEVKDQDFYDPMVRSWP